MLAGAFKYLKLALDLGFFGYACVIIKCMNIVDDSEILVCK